MNYNWIPLQGIFQKTKGKIVFKGEEKVYGKEPDSQKDPAIEKGTCKKSECR